MATKQAIVSALGNDEILLPERIARALIANDQVKYYFALLQMARDNAVHPRVPAPDLRSERHAAQLVDDWLDEVIAGTRGDQTTGYRVPHGPELVRRIRTCVEAMLDPLAGIEREALSTRLAAQSLPRLEQGAITGAEISAMTSGDRKSGDSLHLIVMDAHKAINRLQAESAVETLDGARVHHLSPDGRQRVLAFMQGLNRTSPLKFDHPGLATTATEYKGQLLIQNDIGTTDAHVLVVRVTDLTATLTYTDIHRSRLEFFQSLFTHSGVIWSVAEHKHSDSLESVEYILTTGSFTGGAGSEIDKFLTHLGSRIVYLIDWNKARKRLQGFVGKKAAIDILRWAAERDYGHRGLLEIGGEQALGEAVEFAAGNQLRYGQRLDNLISEDTAAEFLRDALRLASLGLRQKRSRRNIRDEIKARLAGAFETERLGLFRLAGDHAAIGYDLALALVEVLVKLTEGAPLASGLSIATRAAAWESRADLILNEARDDVQRNSRPHSLRDFMEYADDAIDELEEAASIVDLVNLLKPPRTFVESLREIAELVLESSQELVKCIACAASITRSDIRDDLDEFIGSLERISLIEHRADAAERTFMRRLVEQPIDARQILVLRELAHVLESATDAHSHAAMALRSYLMEEVLG
jgi:uncharacterized protein Yka (UPF0111/DUF47 family)